LKLGGWIFVIGAVFAVPVVIARFVLRGSWPAIGLAYAIWFGFLLLQIPVGALSGQASDMAGWAMIFAIYLSIPVISALVLFLRLGKGLGWLISRYRRA
jgi:hypothetical protein